MRKKLLALLMCATMVLGTGVTAFADSVDDAVWKIQNKNDDKFNKEVTANSVNGTVKDTVTFAYVEDGKDKVATVTYGYNASDLTPVVLYTDDHGDTKRATKVVNVTAADGVVNGSNTLATVKAAYANQGLTNEMAAVKITRATGNTSNPTETYLYDGNGTKLLNDGKTVSYVDGTDEWVKCADSTGLLKGNKKLLQSSSINFGEIWTNVSILSDSEEASMTTALYEGVKSGEISDKAFAVKFTPYVKETGDVATATIAGLKGTDVKVARVYSNFSNFVGGTYTLDTDLISQTPLKDCAALDVYKFTGYDAQYSSTFKKAIPGLPKIGTADVDKTYSFDNITTLTGIFVFDEGEAADNNDGISEDTTTAAAADTSANTSASPKTGDVAPIAALAVVMMGACGAMVVASKKRA